MCVCLSPEKLAKSGNIDKSGKSVKNWQKVAKSGRKWLKVEKSDRKWQKVAIVANIGKNVQKVAKKINIKHKPSIL